jgi:hypothetical protein
MKTKTLHRAYMISTGIFAFWLFADGLAGVLQVEAGKVSILALGYPLYILTIVGYAKILAGFAIIQNKCKTLKEWAYAGYAIDCFGALFSQIFTGASTLMIIIPIVFLGIMSVPYILWKKSEGIL